MSLTQTMSCVSEMRSNLSQYAGIRAQTVLHKPSGLFSSQQLGSTPERNHPL